MRLRVFTDADNLADAAAEEVAAWVRHDRAYPTIGLSGGATPQLAYARLRLLRLPWDRAHAWVTERLAKVIERTAATMLGYPIEWTYSTPAREDRAA